MPEGTRGASACGVVRHSELLELARAVRRRIVKGWALAARAHHEWKKVMTSTDIARPGPLMAGKRGLIMGVANDRSIAWGIARVLAGQGAKLAFTYQGDAFGRRAIPLAKSTGADIIVSCDVTDLKSVDNVFAEIKKSWGGLDFVVHALAFS